MLVAMVVEYSSKDKNLFYKIVRLNRKIDFVYFVMSYKKKVPLDKFKKYYCIITYLIFSYSYIPLFPGFSL